MVLTLELQPSLLRCHSLLLQQQRQRHCYFACGPASQRWRTSLARRDNFPSNSRLALTASLMLSATHVLPSLGSRHRTWAPAGRAGRQLSCTRIIAAPSQLRTPAGYGRQLRAVREPVRVQAAQGTWDALPLVAAASLSVVALVMGAQLRKTQLEVRGAGAAFNASILPKLTELEKPYKPYPLLTNRHVETIFAAFFRSLPKLTFRRECLRMADGGTVALDWPQPEVPNPKALLVLLVCLPPLPELAA